MQPGQVEKLCVQHRGNINKEPCTFLHQIPITKTLMFLDCWREIRVSKERIYGQNMHGFEPRTFCLSAYCSILLKILSKLLK